MSTVPSGSETSQVATTIRYEPGLLVSQGSHGGIEDRFKSMSDFYLLAFHQDKMMNAVKHANWSAQLIKLYSGDRGLQLLFARLLLHIHEERRADGPLQLRLTWSRDGKLDISSSSALRPGLLFPFNLFDKAEPSVEAFGTLFKKASIHVLVDGRDPPASESPWSSASSRSNFECASPNHERLIVSQYGEITQGEFTTPYFQRDGAWITPAFSGVAADCVTRRYALEKGLCKEGIVPKSSLKEGDQCWLSDGVRGFCRGTIRFSSVDHENNLAFDTPKTHHPAPKDDMKLQSMNESEL
jgi:4-amino-4-deoxychorismate lyase